MMPPGGAEARTEHLTTLEALQHELFTDDAIGRLLEELRPLEESLPHDDLDACLIRVTRRDWDKATRVPTELAAEIAHGPPRRTTSGWRRAPRRTTPPSGLGSTACSSSSSATSSASRRADDPYDVLLDDFEPGMKTAEVRRSSTG